MSCAETHTNPPAPEEAHEYLLARLRRYTQVYERNLLEVASGTLCVNVMRGVTKRILCDILHMEGIYALNVWAQERGMYEDDTSHIIRGVFHEVRFAHFLGTHPTEEQLHVYAEGAYDKYPPIRHVWERDIV